MIASVTPLRIGYHFFYGAKKISVNGPLHTSFIPLSHHIYLIYVNLRSRLDTEHMLYPLGVHVHSYPHVHGQAVLYRMEIVRHEISEKNARTIHNRKMHKVIHEKGFIQFRFLHAEDEWDESRKG